MSIEQRANLIANEILPLTTASLTYKRVKEAAIKHMIEVEKNNECIPDVIIRSNNENNT